MGDGPGGAGPAEPKPRTGHLRRSKRIGLDGSRRHSLRRMALTMHSARIVRALFVLLAVVGTAACEKVQLLAPTSSTITLSSSTHVLPTGGSTELQAVVIEQAGTPVHNGTTVRFSTTLGRVDPVEAQTRNGIASTT